MASTLYATFLGGLNADKNGEFWQKKIGSQGTYQFLKKPTQIRSLYQDLELIDNWQMADVLSPLNLLT